MNLAGRNQWHNAVLPSTSGRREHEKDSLFLSARPLPGGGKVRDAGTIYALLRYRRHKNSVTACVLVYKDLPEPEVRKKEFETHKKALGNLRWWLYANQVTHVAMESTGVYWKPVWQALEGNFDLILANLYQIKTMPGRKTDARDSQWIAELLAHGLIRRSFVPPRETRHVRDLTRYRVKLVEECNRIHNRIHKASEDACLKLDTIASDILGVSGRRVIRHSGRL